MPKLVTIGWYTEPWNAHIVQGRLQAEEIYSCIIHEHHIWVNWMYSFVLGQVKLQVLEQDVDHGISVLKKIVRGDFEAELEAELGDIDKILCPSCGSDKISQRVGITGTVTAFLVFIIFNVAYPPAKNIQRCDSCMYRWHSN